MGSHLTRETYTHTGGSYAERLLTSPMGSRMVERGNASHEDVEAMAAAFRRWAHHPDAFWTSTQVAALARRARYTPPAVSGGAG